MSAPHTVRRFDPSSSVVFVATAVCACCVGVAATAWWSLDRIHAVRTAHSNPNVVPLGPPAKSYTADPGLEQFARDRTADFEAGAVTHRLFNAASCAECHRQARLGGGGPNEKNVQLLTPLAIARDPTLRRRFGAVSGPVVLHRRSLAKEYDLWRTDLLKSFERSPNLQARQFAFSAADGRPVQTASTSQVVKSRVSVRNVLLEERNTPPLFGLGLLESIPQSELDAVAQSQPQHIRGRSPRLKEGGFGRFGWKSSTATLLAFNENACAVELGLTTPSFTPATFRPAEITPAASNSAPPPQPIMRAARQKAPDMSADDIAALTRYIANLPAPRQVIDPSKRKQVLEGSRHFEAIGCAECHVPNMGSVTGLYSDLLLHEIGTEGGGFYGRPPSQQSVPTSPPLDIIRSNEFRTPPLWGVADSAPYLHDGSAATLTAAIARHSKQAQQSTLAFQNSTPRAQATVIAFLESLRAPQ